MGFEECGLLGAALLRKTAPARPTDISRARTTAASLARVRLTMSVSWPLVAERATCPASPYRARCLPGFVYHDGGCDHP